jgi:hypothetical protein
MLSSWLRVFDGCHHILWQKCSAMSSVLMQGMVRRTWVATICLTCVQLLMVMDHMLSTTR